MGIKRIVDTSFWTDGKVDEFSPEDKYFMLYLLTNPFSTQLGIYEISIKQAAFQMGYSDDSFKALLERFESKYGMIAFSKETNEIAIKNFLRHSIIKGGAPVRDCLIKEMKNVKNKDLISIVFSHIKGIENLNETVKNIIAEYEEKNGTLYYSNEKHNENENNNENNNENENENENENDVSYHDSYNDSCNDTFATKKETIHPQEIIDLFNSICVSLPSVRSLSQARKKAINARLKTYSLDDFKRCFEIAESSSFLKGDNNRNWIANFDWLIKDANMPKVLEGNYANKVSQISQAKPKQRYGDFDPDEAFKMALERSEQTEAKTAGNDEEVRKKAEALKNKIAQSS